MFTHNLADSLSVTTDVSKTKLAVFALFIVLFVFLYQQQLLKPTWQSQVIEEEEKTLVEEPSFAEGYLPAEGSLLAEGSLSAEGSKGSEQAAKEFCAERQSEYKLLGVVHNGDRVITLLQQGLNEVNVLVDNKSQTLTGLILISANLKQAIYQLGSCQFTLTLAHH